MFRTRLTRSVALVCASASAALATPVLGADPAPGAKYAVHDHDTPGDGWHIEVEVSADARQVRRIVLHSERCDATVLAERLAIAPGGVLDYRASFTSRGRRGTWRLNGHFTDAGHLDATFQVVVGACDGGVRTVTAHAGGHHGASAQAHQHGHTSGTPPDSYPDLSRATPRRRAEARRLWRASLRAGRERFPTYRAARRLGFRRYRRNWGKPLVFHLRRHRYATDGRFLDPRRPESLVYWWPVGRSPVLVGFMYRYPIARRPTFGAPLFGWHTHGARPDDQMTHVWMTRSLRSALANCLPVPALEAANPSFRYAPPGNGGSHNAAPCPEEG